MAEIKFHYSNTLSSNPNPKELYFIKNDANKGLLYRGSELIAETSGAEIESLANNVANALTIIQQSYETKADAAQKLADAKDYTDNEINSLTLPAEKVTYSNTDSLIISSDNVQGAVTDVDLALGTHIENASNPHNVTKSQVGLGNVDNTSDINKPVSTLQQEAINNAEAAANQYTDSLLESLVGEAPETLNTIWEIADALKDNPDVVDALNESIANKANVIHTHVWNDLTDRPFGEEEALEVFVPETSEKFYEKLANNLNAWGVPFEELIVGEEYLITVDGVKYSCITYDEYNENNEHNIFLGNSRLHFNDETHPEDVPFHVKYYINEDDNPHGNPEYYHRYVFRYPNSNTHTIKIERPTGEMVINTLDEKYIPNTIARTEYVEANFVLKSDLDNIDLSDYETKEDAQLKFDAIVDAKADWNQNDSSAIDYIKNRTHYKIDTREFLDIQWDGDVNNCISYETFAPIPEFTVEYCKVSDDIISIEDLEQCIVVETHPSETLSYETQEHPATEGMFHNGNNSVGKQGWGIIVVRDETFTDGNGVTLTKGIYFCKFTNLITGDSYGMSNFTSRLYSNTLTIGDFELKQIDEEFIPDTIARMSDIQSIDLTPYETKENAQFKYEELNELVNIQADWNQNDETAINYIHNRTHYELAEQTNNNIFNETLTFETDNTGTAGHHLYYGSAATSITFEADKLYNIVIDGQDFGNIVCNKNLTLTIGETGQDVYWTFSVSSGNLYVDTYDTAASHHIQIGAVEETITVHQLDEKYIPDTIARKTDLENVQVDLSNYYTKDEIDNMELITIAEIDAICGNSVMMAREVVL